MLKTLQEVAGLNQSADKYVAQRTELRKQLETLKDEETKIIQTQAPLEAELSNLVKNLEDTKNKLKELEDFKQNFAGNKDRVQVQVEELGKELQDFKTIQENTLYELDKTKNELIDVQFNVQTAYKKISQMEAQKQAFDEMNFGRAVDTVLNAKIKGVHATLAQLGQVDKEYSTALEVAMGGRMANVVVDDDETARIAIEVLKSANAGRATFLPLNKISKAPRALKLPKDKGVIDFAINLIDFDDEYLNVFFHALGETLVVEDYNSARKLIGQYRMVTLTGELFEKSGSISGGSQKRSGLKFSQTQDDELLKFKERLQAFEKQYADLNKKKEELEIKLDKVRISYSNSMTEYNKAKMELQNLITQAESNENSIKEKQDYIKETEPKIQKIEKDLDEMEQKLVSYNEQALKLDEEIKEIEAKMTPEELQNLKKLTEEKENEIKFIESSIARANNEIDGFNRALVFHDDVIDTKSKEIEKLTADIQIY